MMGKNQEELFAFVLERNIIFNFFSKISVFGDICTSNLMWSYVNILGFSICQDTIK